MANPLRRLLLAVKAVRELGFEQTFWYAVYQVGLRGGYYRLATPPGAYRPANLAVHSPFHLPAAGDLRRLLGSQANALIAEADEIVDGKARLFGGPPCPLDLSPREANRHWSQSHAGDEDIKLTWEPARFGWTYTLGRAYLLTGDERYPRTFWRFFAQFLNGNPPNRGPNWASAQEVALRLIALLFAAGVFSGSPDSTPERMAALAGAAAAHALRIPPTLSYARAQNNNHLISEALGLYLAGTCLPGHPRAAAWQSEGWRWLNRALQAQIMPDGTYAQHSMNYHRLMLHAALQAGLAGRPLAPAAREKLAAAATWLLAQVDPLSGRAPNLGSNDGALILPLSPGGQDDYRPVAQAAARAFLGRPAFPPGPWDELSLWLGLPLEPAETLPALPASPAVHRLGDEHAWATLRAVRFAGRPSHADQLHVDLWWRGENIARDAGTFRYTAPPPWDNALALTRVHNTVEVNSRSQMTRAGRFLWLDWAQAGLLDPPGTQGDALIARHAGYGAHGVLHTRELRREGPSRWLVTDQMRDLTGEPQPARAQPHLFRLHWLLPDWPWSLEEDTLALSRPGGGGFTLRLSASASGIIALIRAGTILAGEHPDPAVMGWFSPTYNTRLPALSAVLAVRAPLPCDLFSAWTLDLS